MWPNESRVPPKVKKYCEDTLRNVRIKYLHTKSVNILIYFKDIVLPNESRVPPKVTQYCEDILRNV